MINKKDNQCPCGTGLDYAACCGQYIERIKTAPSAEALMRSRYTAYVKQNTLYLRSTWYPSTCPANLDLAENQQWIGLKIIDIQGGNADDKTGQVEFVARYKMNGRAEKLHECSEFVRVNDRWLYVGALVDG